MKQHNLTPNQKLLLQSLKEGSVSFELIKKRFHPRTIQSLCKRNLIQLNIKPTVSLKS